MVWKLMVCSRQVSNNGRCINGKDWTGVHSSLEVLSLDKQHGMKGKQITAGQLTRTEQGITMQLLAMSSLWKRQSLSMLERGVGAKQGSVRRRPQAGLDTSKCDDTRSTQ